MQEEYVSVEEKLPLIGTDVLVKYKYYNELVKDIATLEEDGWLLRRQKYGYFPGKIKIISWRDIPD